MSTKPLILIIDDLPENLRVLGDMLEMAGYEVLVATSGADVVTPDIQLIHGARKQSVALLPANRRDIDDATIIGLRLQLLF